MLSGCDTTTPHARFGGLQVPPRAGSCQAHTTSVMTAHPLHMQKVMVRRSGNKKTHTHRHGPRANLQGTHPYYETILNL
eukprot:966825-Amphidinium_carterae.2